MAMYYYEGRRRPTPSPWPILVFLIIVMIFLSLPAVQMMDAVEERLSLLTTGGFFLLPIALLLAVRILSPSSHSRPLPRPSAWQPPSIPGYDGPNFGPLIMVVLFFVLFFIFKDG